LSLATQPHKSLWIKSQELFSNVLNKIVDAVEKVELAELGIKIRAGLSTGNWADKGNQLFTILNQSDKPVLLLLDEVPIMVNRILKDENGKITPEGKKQAEEFMSWLRYNSSSHQGGVRIILSGSIGFEPVLNQANLSATLNTFSPYDLKPWNDHTAIGCLNALASEYGVQFKNDAQAEMIHRLGCCIPHHVQMFFTNVYDHCKHRERMEFYADEVEDVYKLHMLSVRGHAELTHYEERLKSVLGAELFPLALEILTEAAVVGRLSHEALGILQKNYEFEAQTTTEALRQILQVLEHDGYLKRHDHGHGFISNLLRDWWKKRYEAFFIPTSSREV
jgi:hypothetical protein